MNEQTYDDYIRDILGFQNHNMNMYESQNRYDDMYSTNYDVAYRHETINEDLERHYPEIYRIIYPMVVRKAQFVTGPLTRELIDGLTDEIYSAVEDDTEMNPEDTTEIDESGEMVEDRSCCRRRRRPKNPGLRDLIQVLLLRDLIRRRRPFHHHRPPHHHHRPRPPIGIMPFIY